MNQLLLAAYQLGVKLAFRELGREREPAGSPAQAQSAGDQPLPDGVRGSSGSTGSAMGGALRGDTEWKDVGETVHDPTQNATIGVV